MQKLDIDFTKHKDLIKQVLLERSKVIDTNWEWTIRSISKHTISINWSYLQKKDFYFKLNYTYYDVCDAGYNSIYASKTMDVYYHLVKQAELISSIEVRDWDSDKGIKMYLESIISTIINHALYYYL